MLLGGTVWLLRDPSEGFFGKAFAALLGYTVLFRASLLKIWSTAGKPAIAIDAAALAYEPLSTSRRGASASTASSPAARALAPSPFASWS